MVSEKELIDINLERLKKILIYIKNNLVDSDNIMYLAVDQLIDRNNIKTNSNKITPRKVNVKLYGYDKFIWIKI